MLRPDPDPDTIRVRLVDSAGPAVTVDLPTRHGREHGTWWYTGALRHHRPDTVRVYLAHDNHTIGIGLAVRDDTGTPPRTVGRWPPPN